MCTVALLLCTEYIKLDEAQKFASPHQDSKFRTCDLWVTVQFSLYYWSMSHSCTFNLLCCNAPRPIIWLTPDIYTHLGEELTYFTLYRTWFEHYRDFPQPVLPWARQQGIFTSDIQETITWFLVKTGI